MQCTSLNVSNCKTDLRDTLETLMFICEWQLETFIYFFVINEARLHPVTICFIYMGKNQCQHSKCLLLCSAEYTGQTGQWVN